MATIVSNPLIPEHAKPKACARLRCVMALRDPDEDASVGRIFVHQDPDGSVDEYPIPKAWLDDVDKDIWAEIKPWMAGLHDEGKTPGA